MALSQVKRVIVVRLDEIGDVVMTTSFLRELRRNLPDAWITLLVQPAVYNLVELCPYVNEALAYDRHTKGHFRQFKRQSRALHLAWKHLWPRRFDLAIVPRWDVDHYQATFIAYLSGAPWRMGYSENVSDYKRHRNSGFNHLFTHVLDDNTLKHEVKHNLDVIRCLGGMVQEDRLEVWTGEDDEAFADNVFREHGVEPDERVVGFSLSGGSSPLKQWPVSNFIELGRWLWNQYNSRLVVVGGPGEEALGWKIEQELSSASINMVGQTTLRQTAALLKRCHLYVGCDSGPMHIAAATGIPVVALFGSSCHHRFGPWGHPHAVVCLALPCSPCFQSDHPNRCRRCIFDTPHCMLGITPERVQQSVEAQLSRQRYSLS